MKKAQTVHVKMKNVAPKPNLVVAVMDTLLELTKLVQIVVVNTQPMVAVKMKSLENSMMKDPIVVVKKNLSVVVQMELHKKDLNMINVVKFPNLDVVKEIM